MRRIYLWKTLENSGFYYKCEGKFLKGYAGYYNDPIYMAKDNSCEEGQVMMLTPLVWRQSRWKKSHALKHI